MAVICVAIGDFVYSVLLQKGESAEAMAFKKHAGLREALSAQLRGEPSSFLRFVSFFLFLSHVSQHSLDVLRGCFCKKP